MSLENTNMRFELLDVQSKGEGWKIVTAKEAIEGGRTFTEVSINEKDKNTGAVVWPTFNQMAVGDFLEADYWRSPANKQYLFAPKPKQASTGNSSGFKGGSGVKAAQERKGEMIEKAQENKQTGIMVSAAMRDATQITIASLKEQPFPTDAEFTYEFTKWRDWYIKKWQETEKIADIPF